MLKKAKRHFFNILATLETAKTVKTVMHRKISLCFSTQGRKVFPTF